MWGRAGGLHVPLVMTQQLRTVTKDDLLRQMHKHFDCRAYLSSGGASWLDVPPETTSGTLLDVRRRLCACVCACASLWKGEAGGWADVVWCWRLLPMFAFTCMRTLSNQFKTIRQNSWMPWHHIKERKEYRWDLGWCGRTIPLVLHLLFFPLFFLSFCWTINGYSNQSSPLNRRPGFPAHRNISQYIVTIYTPAQTFS